MKLKKILTGKWVFIINLISIHGFFNNSRINILSLIRTFPQHVYFSPSGAGETGLRQVLQAFALHNPSIGYCQSLNFLTGMMLIFMQEEDVFWLLITVVERLLPEDYYTKNMVGTYVDQYVLAHIIKKCLPRVNRYAACLYCMVLLYYCYYHI